jgi:hypothetical protein
MAKKHELLKLDEALKKIQEQIPCRGISQAEATPKTIRPG